MLSYEGSLRLFERWCAEEMGITEVDKVTENVIRKYIAHLQERGKYTFYSDADRTNTNFPERRRDFSKPISLVSINNYLRNMRVFFNWLEEECIITKNPMKKVRLLRVERQAKEYMGDEEFKKLVKTLDRSYYPEHRDYALMMLILDSGMRLGECSCLLMDDLDIKNRSILLRAEITKGRKDRVVFFSSRTEAVLRRWISYKDRYVESDYLFPMKSNGTHITVNGFERNFRNYLRRAGIEGNYSPHCLRNNFAKRCLMNGMDIYTLSRILGHSSVTVTEKAYLDLTDEDLGKRYQHYSPIEGIF